MRLIALLATGVLTPFLPPAPYGPGHRGVDFSAQPGARVSAPHEGQVTFVGAVNKVGTVTIAFGSTKVTLQPVEAIVRQGQSVARGEVIGTVQSHVRYHCSACLHLGVRENGKYVNPLGYASAQLLPLGRSSWIAAN